MKRPFLDFSHASPGRQGGYSTSILACVDAYSWSLSCIIQLFLKDGYVRLQRLRSFSQITLNNNNNNTNSSSSSHSSRSSSGSSSSSGYNSSSRGNDGGGNDGGNDRGNDGGMMEVMMEEV